MTAEAADAILPVKRVSSLKFRRLAETVVIPVGALVVSAIVFSIFLLVIGNHFASFLLDCCELSFFLCSLQLFQPSLLFGLLRRG